MIYPNDVPISTASDRDAQECSEVEKYFDRKILENATGTGKWPLRLPTTRCSWRNHNIQAVIAMYKHAGWIVTPGDQSCYAILDHPFKAGV